MNAGLQRLNGMARHDAAEALMRCCGSSRWAAKMADRRPFDSMDDLLRNADDVWRSLGARDHLEAFGHHPRIGESAANAPRADPTGTWSAFEQSGMARAPDALRDRIARGNDEYFAKFGFVFLICATGRSAEEMHAELQRRLGSDRSTELANAAEQQRLITRLRLERLLQS